MVTCSELLQLSDLVMSHVFFQCSLDEDFAFMQAAALACMLMQVPIVPSQPRVQIDLQRDHT